MAPVAGRPAAWWRASPPQALARARGSGVRREPYACRERRAAVVTVIPMSKHLGWVSQKIQDACAQDTNRVPLVHSEHPALE